MPADPRLSGSGGELYSTVPTTTQVRRIPKSNNVTTVGGVGSSITVPYVPPTIRAEDRPAGNYDDMFPVVPAANTDTNINPYGGVRTSGGGSSTTPGLDQGSFNSMLDMIRGTRPYRYDHTALDLPDYKAPAFYGFSSEPYDVAQRTINDQIREGTASGNRTYDDARYELDQYQNPYGNVRTTNPGVRDAMSRMMQANGVNPDINAQVDWEGQQADDAFGYTQALLAGTADQQQAGNLRALGGDRRRFNESMGTEGRLMGAQVQMALARAKSQYEKDKWTYGVDEARRRHDQTVAEVMANNQGVNQANQANIGAANSWNQSTVDSLIELILSGRNSKGVQGLDLTAIPGMTQWEMNK